MFIWIYLLAILSNLMRFTVQKKLSCLYTPPRINAVYLNVSRRSSSTRKHKINAFNYKFRASSRKINLLKKKLCLQPNHLTPLFT